MARHLLDEAGGEAPETEMADNAGRSLKRRFNHWLTGLKKGMGKKWVIFSLLGLVLLMAVAVCAWIFFFNPSPEAPVTAGDPLPAEGVPSALEAGPPSADLFFKEIVTLAPFDHIPLKNSSALSKVNLTVCLELMVPEDRGQVTGAVPRIRQIVQKRMRRHTWLELRNPEGKIKLKYDLLTHINDLFPSPVVRDLYFTNFLMQQ